MIVEPPRGTLRLPRQPVSGVDLARRRSDSSGRMRRPPPGQRLRLPPGPTIGQPTSCGPAQCLTKSFRSSFLRVLASEPGLAERDVPSRESTRASGGATANYIAARWIRRIAGSTSSAPRYASERAFRCFQRRMYWRFPRLNPSWLAMALNGFAQLPTLRPGTRTATERSRRSLDVTYGSVA